MNNKYNTYVNSEDFKKETNLCKIMRESGSDKSSDWHNYTSLYHYLFKDLETKNINLFEVGIFFGSSIKGWKSFFQKGKIYAGDIDLKTLIKEERIESFFCDQDDIESIKKMWENNVLKNLYFDIIIDDGKHEYQSNINFLLHSFNKLKNNGFFIIEDITNIYLSDFYNSLQLIESSFNPQYLELVKIPNIHNYLDNNILIIQK